MNLGYVKYKPLDGVVGFFYVTGIHQQTETATVVLEISDWNGVSPGDLTPTRSFLMNGKYYCMVGIDQTKLFSDSTEQEFNENLILNVIDCGRMNRNADVIRINFKNTPERTALLQYGLRS